MIQQLEIINCCRGIHKSYSILVLSLDGFFSFNSCILIVVRGAPSLIGILFLFNSLHHPQRACQSFTRTKNPADSTLDIHTTTTILTVHLEATRVIVVQGRNNHAGFATLAHLVYHGLTSLQIVVVIGETAIGIRILRCLERIGSRVEVEGIIARFKRIFIKGIRVGRNRNLVCSTLANGQIQNQGIVAFIIVIIEPDKHKVVIVVLVHIENTDNGINEINKLVIHKRNDFNGQIRPALEFEIICIDFSVPSNRSVHRQSLQEEFITEIGIVTSKKCVGNDNAGQPHGLAKVSLFQAVFGNDWTFQTHLNLQCRSFRKENVLGVKVRKDLVREGISETSIPGKGGRVHEVVQEFIRAAIFSLSNGTKAIVMTKTENVTQFVRTNVGCSIDNQLVHVFLNSLRSLTGKRKVAFEGTSTGVHLHEKVDKVRRIKDGPILLVRVEKVNILGKAAKEIGVIVINVWRTRIAIAQNLEERSIHGEIVKRRFKKELDGRVRDIKRIALGFFGGKFKTVKGGIIGFHTFLDFILLFRSQITTGNLQGITKSYE